MVLIFGLVFIISRLNSCKGAGRNNLLAKAKSF